MTAESEGPWKKLGAAINLRRTELGLSIEAAATLAETSDTSVRLQGVCTGVCPKLCPRRRPRLIGVVPFAVMGGVLLGVFLLGLYALPIMLAADRRHSQLVPLAIINVLLGWTLIGWAACLAWAFSENNSQDPFRKPRQASQRSSPALHAELERLFDLHQRGALTDAEYAAAKARLLS